MKAQTATEYLIILAVVIVISLITIGVLGGIPSIGGNTEKKTRLSYLKSLPIGITEYKVGCSGTSIYLRNNLQETIQITSISIDDTVCDPFDSFVLKTGQRQVVECLNVYDSEENKNYEYYTKINYTDVSTGAKYEQENKQIAIVGRTSSCSSGVLAGISAEMRSTGSDSTTNGSITIGVSFSTT